MSSETILTVNKFDVAEKQLNQAIHLFFSGGDQISIHTLSEAASQVLYDINGKNSGRVSILRDTSWVRPEYKKEWLTKLTQARNYFKHADRDPQAEFNFNVQTNHFSILDAVQMYVEMKKSWTPESLIYTTWFFLTYPQLLNKDSTMAKALANRFDGPYAINPKNLDAMYEAMTELRGGVMTAPGVTLSAGLPT